MNRRREKPRARAPGGNTSAAPGVHPQQLLGRSLERRLLAAPWRAFSTGQRGVQEGGRPRQISRLEQVVYTHPAKPSLGSKSQNKP